MSCRRRKAKIASRKREGAPGLFAALDRGSSSASAPLLVSHIIDYVFARWHSAVLVLWILAGMLERH
jgi:hypothetical protein